MQHDTSFCPAVFWFKRSDRSSPSESGLLCLSGILSDIKGRMRCGEQEWDIVVQTRDAPHTAHDQGQIQGAATLPPPSAP